MRNIERLLRKVHCASSISLDANSVKIYLYCQLITILYLYNTPPHAFSKYNNIPYSIQNKGYSLEIDRTS